ncbi:hypothetical protein ACWDZ6_11070 [Streptomyces sp. NPDC002926]
MRSRRKTAAAWLCAAALLAAGCGTEKAGRAPEGWGTLRTTALTVAHPPAFTPQGGAERGKHNAAAATLTAGGRAVGVITVQLDFTEADTAEEAAIGAEAGIALGSKLHGQRDVKVTGPDGREAEARRVDFEFSLRATRIKGVIVAGLDAAKKAYAVRIDAADGRLADEDLKKIIGSITVMAR